MTAWSKLSSDERDRVMLAAAFLNEPDPIYVNPRSKNDCEWVASLVERKLLSKTASITRAGKRALRKLGAKAKS